MLTYSDSALYLNQKHNFVNFTFIAVDVAVKLITIYEANYPEYLSNILVVNGKWWTIFVRVQISILKHFQN